MIVPVLLAVLSALLALSDGLWRIDLLFYDAAARSFFKPAPPDVILVGIDEKSLAALGRWPWPRRLHARLIEKLTRAGVAAIAYDVAFAEPGDPADDASLAAALRASGVAVLPVVPEQSAAGGMVETLPLPSLAMAAALGHVDVELDPDGLARSLYLRAGLGSPRWPAFARAVLDVAERRPPRPPVASANGSAPYLWTRDERLLVAFTGPPGRFRQLSFSDVLEHPLPGDWPPRAIVLVGLTAAGLGDSLPTPVSGHARPMPGVEFVANVVQGLRSGWVLRYLDPSATVGVTALLVLLSALALAWLPRPLWVALVSAMVALGLSLLLLRVFRLWFTPAAALAGVALAYPLATWSRHRRDRAFLHRERALKRTALASVAEAVLTTDRAGRIEYANPVAASWLGRSAEELVGKSLEKTLDLRTAEDQKVRWDRPEGDLVEAVLFAAGSPREVRASFTPIGPRSEGHGLVVALDARGPGLPAPLPVETRGPLAVPSDRPAGRSERFEIPPGLERATLERDLGEAIANGGLEVVYQPQLEIATRTIVGVEALARWRHPLHGPVPTSLFIALAEGSGLIAPLGEWILRAACRRSAAWTTPGRAPLRISVNVSPQQAVLPELAATVAAALQREGLDPARLTLELTESERLSNLDATAAAFAEIRRTGVTLALDDFGVGYSSLEHLRKLPVDIVKIDKSFVEAVTTEPSSRSICLAVLAMAQSLGRRVVAEGVETSAQAEFFRSRGCDEIQGYLVSPPLAAEEVQAFLDKGDWGWEGPRSESKP